jgi:hypothetical protein
MRIADALRSNAPTDAVLVTGRVATSPEDFDEELYVLIDRFDQRFRWGPCPWPRRGDELPARGDRALVARVDGETWCIAWWPR